MARSGHLTARTARHGTRRRVWWLLALAASVAVAMGATPGGAVAGDSGVWSSPITIVPSSEQTSGASLSVSAGGSALAA